MRGARLVLLALALLPARQAVAEETCNGAIEAAAQANPAIPAHLLRAIAVVESGRADPESGRIEPWPWSVNAAGEGHRFDSRDDAIAFVTRALAQGIRSIDVGCMQVNLMYHPLAFASLQEAFAPGANVRYAAAFLLDLYRRLGDWTAAAGSYHSATPVLAEAYASRVLAAGQAPGPALRPFGAGPLRVYSPGSGQACAIVMRPDLKLPRVYVP